jgi:universal stress protein E
VIWRRILLVVDSSWASTSAALLKVAQLASGCAAEIEVFSAVYDPALSELSKVHEALERRRSELEPIARALCSEFAHAHVAVRWAFPPREGIVQQVRAHKPDLVILRSSSHSRLARLLFTYSDYKLIETLRCPILILKNDRPYRDARVIAAIDPMHSHDKPATLDERIIEVGASLAAATKLPLHVYHACAVMPLGAPAEERVRRLAEAASIPAERVHIETGEAATLLPRFVSADSGDLVVMGAVSRSCFRKAVIGYTAEKVLDATDCDLLVVKPARGAASQRSRSQPVHVTAGRAG